MRKEQDSGYDSYSEHTDQPSVRKQRKVPTSYSSAEKKRKKSEREKLLDWIKGLHPGDRVTVVLFVVFFLNSWLLFFALLFTSSHENRV